MISGRRLGLGCVFLCIVFPVVKFVLHSHFQVARARPTTLLRPVNSSTHQTLVGGDVPDVSRSPMKSIARTSADLPNVGDGASKASSCKPPGSKIPKACGDKKSTKSSHPNYLAKMKELADARCKYKDTSPVLAKEVAIIYLGKAPLSRIPSLSASYRPHFAQVAFLGEHVELQQRRQDGVMTWYCDMDFPRYCSYICVAKFLRWLETREEFNSMHGAAYFHADLFLHPSYLALRLEANPKAIISVAQGFDYSRAPGDFKRDFDYHVSKCTRALVTPGLANCRKREAGLFDAHDCGKVSDFKKFSFIEGLELLMEKFSANLTNLTYNIADISSSNVSINATFEAVDRQFFPLQHATKDWLCYGWTDFYRLPRNIWHEFSLIADMFLHRARYHDIVVPTILGKLAAKVGLQVDMMWCYGGALSHIKNLRQIYELPCGHRMYLERPDTLPCLEVAVRDG